jgi:hypothetical protein
MVILFQRNLVARYSEYTDDQPREFEEWGYIPPPSTLDELDVALYKEEQDFNKVLDYENIELYREIQTLYRVSDYQDIDYFLNYDYAEVCISSCEYSPRTFYTEEWDHIYNYDENLSALENKLEFRELLSNNKGNLRRTMCDISNSENGLFSRIYNSVDIWQKGDITDFLDDKSVLDRVVEEHIYYTELRKSELNRLFIRNEEEDNFNRLLDCLDIG